MLDDAEKRRVYLVKKRWREANRERVTAKNKEWRLANPDKVRAHETKRRGRRGVYYQANKDQYIERNRRWRLANPERWRAMGRASQRRNPQANADRAARRRARERGNEWEPVDRVAVYARDNGICHLCGQPVPFKTFTLDHIIPVVKGGPHKPSNLAVAHKSCNSRKRDRLI